MDVWIIVLLASCVGAASITSGDSYDTIVIGLGASGTTAASTLARAGRNVLALEAQGRIGGRVYTVPFGDGIVELGAEWIHGQENSSVYDLAIWNNVTILPDNLTIKTVRSDGSRVDFEMVKDLVIYAMESVNDPQEEPEPTGQYMTRKSSWHSNQYTRGSFTYDDVSAPLHRSARADLAQPITDGAGNPRILFAGEATEVKRFGTVHGAVDSGYREAARLLASKA